MRRALYLLAFSLLPAAALAAGEAPTYQLPPAEIVQLADAPPTPHVVPSPDGKALLVAELPPFASIDALAQPEVKLAGLRFNPETTDHPRQAPYRRLSIIDVPSGNARVVAGLPADGEPRAFSWSPDSAHLALEVGRGHGIELWIIDRASAQARALPGFTLNAAAPGLPFRWLSDSRSLVVRARPSPVPSVSSASHAPRGPVVQENDGKARPEWTFTDTLKSPEDADRFEALLTSVLLRVNLDGTPAPLGPAALYVMAAPSPDGKHVLVESLHRPFSYLVNQERFPRRVEIWSLEGKLEHRIADLSLADQVPLGFSAVRTGPRDFEWRSDAPATVVWAEAQDGGDPKKKVEIRDRVYALAAPFRAKPVELAALGLRYAGVEWGNDDAALVSETWWDTRKTRTWRIHPGVPTTAPQKLFDRSYEDRYGDPGAPLEHPNAQGFAVMQLVKGGAAVLLAGAGASPEGDQPFVDELDLATGKSTRRWRSAAPFYEAPVRALDEGGTQLLTRRESVTVPPNYFVRALDSGQLTAVTRFPHPTPALKNVHKELIRYSRADGVKLTATLYLPPGYDSKKQGPLPMLMWAYPHEYKSAEAAGQVTTSPYRFVRITGGSPLFWLARGYAVLDDPTFPIVGEGTQEPNDTYVAQLTSSAQAAVDEVVRRGVADRDRIAIGGHSYGAFTTANLLAHTDLFRAGIARSGAYNRTLTPFGFQQEQRTFWQTPETYIQMSPFTHADKINEPLLLIHGMDDNNTGTFPIQSERLYQAMKGLGSRVRLVMLPLESHGYQARESVMHMLYEMDRWLDAYVKHASPRAAPKGGPTPGAKSAPRYLLYRESTWL